MDKSIKLNIPSILVIFLLLETLCITYALDINTIIPLATYIYTISGLAISILLLRIKGDKISFDSLKTQWSGNKTYKILIAIAILMVMIYFTRNTIANNPLSFYDADMLPIMKTMSSRLLSGDLSEVYEPIAEIWNGIQPIYLPAMWGPFTISEFLHIDPRWITTFATYFSILIFIFIWKPVHPKMVSTLLLIGFGLLFWRLETDPIHNFFRLSEEGVVVFYYCLLAVSLYTENYILIGITSALCMLSRFFIVGWIPALVIHLMLKRPRKKQIIQLIVSGVSILILLVIIPFGWKPILIALELPTKYIQHAEKVWGQNPEFFSNSMGMAKFFGLSHLPFQQVILMVSTIILPTCFVMIAKLMNSKWNIENTMIPIASLKFTLVLALTFISVPYQYLFFTSSFVSFIAIGLALHKRSVLEN